jgi:hypothetical protein
MIGRKASAFAAQPAAEQAATWEQAGAAPWDCLTDLAPKLSEQPAKGMLPLVKLVDARAVQFKRGSTVVPILQIVKWVDRPDCLKEGAVAGIATEPAARQASTCPGCASRAGHV